MLAKKRGRPKKFLDSQMEEMAETQVQQTGIKTKETMEFFTGKRN
jgi:hypothetical protein